MINLKCERIIALSSSVEIIGKSFVKNFESAGNLTADSVKKNMIILIVMGSIACATLFGVVYFLRTDYRERRPDKVAHIIIGQDKTKFTIESYLTADLPDEFTEKIWYLVYWDKLLVR